MVIPFRRSIHRQQDLLIALFEALKHGVVIGALNPDHVESYFAVASRENCARIRKRLEVTHQIIADHSRSIANKGGH